jgi:hypothetical protein
MTDYNAAPAAPQPAAPAENPGKTLGIVGLILAFFFQLPALIVSIIGLNKSKKAGFKNGPALAGIILSIVFGIGWIIGTIVLVAGLATIGADPEGFLCDQVGTGTYEVEGETIVCD